MNVTLTIVGGVGAVCRTYTVSQLFMSGAAAPVGRFVPKAPRSTSSPLEYIALWKQLSSKRRVEDNAPYRLNPSPTKCADRAYNDRANPFCYAPFM